MLRQKGGSTWFPILMKIPIFLLKNTLDIYTFYETKVKIDKNVILNQNKSSKNDPRTHFWAILDHFLALWA